MEITNATKTLLFTQQQFFQNESFHRRLALPALLTILYAGTAAAFAAGMNVSGLAGHFVLNLIAWPLIAALFYFFLRVIGHARCGYVPVLAVTGYAAVPLLIGTVLTGVISSTVGGFSGVLTALMSAAVLLWCIPIWVYGIAAVTNLPVKSVLFLLIIPVLLIFAVELWGMFAGGTSPASGMPGNSGGGASTGMTRGPSGGGMAMGTGGGGGPR
ncbi:MAG TPA: YIP1 family protein [Methanocorpusculum sp.]|nr:YIP1 family protein [Methanocorpusculum sp.]